MQAGKLRHRVDVQRRPLAKDSAGQRSGAWENVLTSVQADIHDLSGRELISAQLIAAEATVVVIVRGFSGWRSQIRPDMRVVFEGRLFDIKGVTNPDGVDRELRILCVEIVG